jgi:CarD family transcriptional regulator
MVTDHTETEVAASEAHPPPNLEAPAAPPAAAAAKPLQRKPMATKAVVAQDVVANEEPAETPRPAEPPVEAEPVAQADVEAAPAADPVPDVTVDAEAESATDALADVEPEEDSQDAAPEVRRPASGGMRGMMSVNGRPPHMPRLPSKAENFVEGDYVVYPTHGVGRVERIAEEEIAGHHLQLIHITFEENRMTLRVPVTKARSAGLRKLATRDLFDEAMAVLKGRARIKRTMWSRRAQEYQEKINSGAPLAIAEVVRDLHRNSGQPDQSFSERQIYEQALDRLAAELAALDQTDKATATTKLVNYLKTIA